MITLAIALASVLTLGVVALCRAAAPNTDESEGP